MSSKSSDCLTAVPGRDESILAALAEIDQKLTAWSEAMGRAQAVITERARALIEQEHSGSLALETQREAPHDTRKDSLDALTEDSAPDSEAAVERTTTESDRADSAAVARRLGDASIDVDASAVNRTDAASSGAAIEEQTEFEAIGEPVDEEIALPPPPTQVVHPDDDESLLAGLDPEAAKAIKVRRRLLDGVKTLRQLVEEHKTQGSQANAPKGGKKSWWSRG